MNENITEEQVLEYIKNTTDKQLIRRMLSILGKKTVNRVDPKMIEKARQLDKKGLSKAQIGKKIGKSAITIRRYLNKLRDY